MELSKTIKRLRTEKGWSQETLAEHAYVSRQTVSNWENEKSFPDVHSLLILSGLFGVSLDELIKGDVEIMKNTVKKEDVKAFKRIQLLGVLEILLLIAAGVPLVEYFGAAGGAVVGALAVCTLMTFHRFEQMKGENDIQTYREVLAFVNGETLDDIEKEKELQKRASYRKLYIVTAVLTIGLLIFAAICAVLQIL